MKVVMAFCVSASPATSWMARGDAPAAADENAATMIDREKVATPSMLDAMTPSRLSSVLRSMSGSRPAGMRRLPTAATIAISTATTLPTAGLTQRRLSGDFNQMRARYTDMVWVDR